MSKWLGGMTFMSLVWGTVHLCGSNTNAAMAMIVGLCCLAFFSFTAGADIF